MDKNIFDHLNVVLNNLSPEEGLEVVSNRFGNRAKFSTSSGLEDQIVTHLIADHSLEIEIFTLDTGRLFQETYDVFDLTKQRYKVNIVPYFPDRSRVEE